MTSSDARTELQMAERALAEFDASSLTTDDGQPNLQAEERLAKLQARVLEVKARLSASAA